MNKQSNKTDHQIFRIDQEDGWKLIIASDEKLKELGMDPSRGFLFLGPPGTGKTALLEAHRAIQKRTKPLINASDIASKSIKYNGSSFDHSMYDLYIDDLGSEQIRNVDFGHVEYRSTQFLESRWRIFDKNEIKTHASSNLSLSSILETYGDRIYSRLSMFNIVIIEGDDYRIKGGNRNPYKNLIEEYKSKN